MKSQPIWPFWLCLVCCLGCTAHTQKKVEEETAATDPAQSAISEPMLSFDDVRSIVVMLDASLIGESAFGAGIIVSIKDGIAHVLTANHNVRTHDGTRASRVAIRFRQRRESEYRAEIVDKYDADLDVALLRIKVDNVTDDLLPLGRFRAHAAAVAQEVRRVGQPNKHPWWSSPRTDAVVQADGDLVQFESPTIARGDSGGGLFLRSGTLLGLVTEDSVPPTATAVGVHALARLCRQWGVGFDLAMEGVASEPAQPNNDAAVSTFDDNASWMQLSARPDALPVVPAFFWGTRDILLNITQGDVSLSIRLNGTKNALSPPVHFDESEPFRVEVSESGAFSPNTITEQKELDFVQLKSGVRLRLPYSKQFRMSNSDASRTGSMVIVLRVVPFYPNHKSGINGQPAGASELRADRVLNGRLSFDEGNDKDYWKLVNIAEPCQLAVIVDRPEEIAVEKTDGSGQSAISLPLINQNKYSGSWLTHCSTIGNGRLLLKAKKPGAATDYQLFVIRAGAPAPLFEAWFSRFMKKELPLAKFEPDYAEERFRAFGASTEQLRAEFGFDRCLMLNLLDKSLDRGRSFHSPWHLLEVVLATDLGSYETAIHRCGGPNSGIAVAALLRLEDGESVDERRLGLAARLFDDYFLDRLITALRSKRKLTDDGRRALLRIIFDRPDISDAVRETARYMIGRFQ